MKLGIMQPYFLPHIGYFQLLNQVDTFVVYDDVNYIKKGWINRNNIIINGQKRLFTISLKGVSQNKLINELEITDDFERLRRTISMSYAKAPYFRYSKDLFEKIASYNNKNLSMFIANSLEILSSYLGLTTKIIFSSEIQKDKSLRGQKKIIAICKELNATTYINPIGGQKLYEKEYFKEHGVDLYFIKTIYTPYKQFVDEFEPGLSILDVLMHNSSKETKELLKNYELV